MIKELISQIESILAATYRFDPLVSASDYIIDDNQLKAMNIDVTQRAAVVFDDQSEDLFIGLFLNETIKELVTNDDPRHALHNDNIDPLCVIAEEISHFHLILQRKFHDLPTSLVELEWQAEIDKLLVASKLLYEQHGHSHLSQLRQHLYESVASISRDGPYELANDLAAKFWHKYDNLPHRRQEPLQCPILDNLLFRFYRASFGAKHTMLEQTSLKVA